MTDPSASSDNISSVIARIDEFCSSAQWGEALRFLQKALSEAPNAAPLHEHAVAVLTDLLSHDVKTKEHDDSALRDICSRLVRVEIDVEQLRPLHHTIASLLTSDNRQQARDLTIFIAKSAYGDDLCTTEIEKGDVLLLLVARSVLPDDVLKSIDLTDLHSRFFPKFSGYDLSLPYSVMFNEHAFGQNRDDLLRFYPSPQTALAPKAGLGFRHLLTLEWLGLSPIFQRGNTDDLVKALTERQLDSTDDDRKAARSFWLRYRPNDVAPTDLIDVYDLPTAPPEKPQPGEISQQPSADLNSSKSIVWNAGINSVRMAFPMVNRLLPRPRVALCVSGQLRGYRRAFPTWKKALLPFADFDIFVHSWSNVGRASPAPFRAYLPLEGEAFCAEWRRIGTLEGLESLQQRYPSLFLALSEDTTVSTQDIKEFFGAREAVIEDDQSDAFTDFSNQDKMHYKIHEAHQLAMHTDENYDLVMRLRPDLGLGIAGFSWKALSDICVSRPVLYAGDAYGFHYGKLMIDDQIALGGVEAMSVYASTYERYPSLAKMELAGAPQELTGHVSLAQTCWLSGVDVEVLPFKRQGLMEMDSLSSQTIISALETDSAGRNDDVDRAFLKAARSDLV